MKNLDLEKAFWAIVLAAIAALAGLGIVAVAMSARSNGNIDYCYVEMLSPQGMAPQYQLYGHRPWRVDRAMGVYPTLEEAKDKADVVTCKVSSSN